MRWRVHPEVRQCTSGDHLSDGRGLVVVIEPSPVTFTPWRSREADHWYILPLRLTVLRCTQPLLIERKPDMTFIHYDEVHLGQRLLAHQRLHTAYLDRHIPVRHVVRRLNDANIQYSSAREHVHCLINEAYRRYGEHDLAVLDQRICDHLASEDCLAPSRWTLQTDTLLPIPH